MYLPSGHLMYVDSIYVKTFKEVAKLVSPMTTVPMSGCLSFQYQRSEWRGNIFSVFTRDRLGQYQELWKAENQSDRSEMLGEWTPVQVDLKAPYSVQVNINILLQLCKEQTLSHLLGLCFFSNVASSSNTNLHILIVIWILGHQAR